MTTETTIDLFDLDGLSMRSTNALYRAGYRKVSDFKGVNAQTLLDLDGFGKRGLAELEQCLEPFGISFVEPVLTVRALVDALRHGPRNDVSCAHIVGFPKDEVKEGLKILEEHGVVSHRFDDGASTYRLNPWFLRVCDGRAA